MEAATGDRGKRALPLGKKEVETDESSDENILDIKEQSQPF
jgi:hypothetical protein